MKRTIMLTVTIALAMLVLAACAGSPDQTGNESSQSSANANGGSTVAAPQEIVVSYNQGEFAWPVYERLAEAYKEKTGHTVTFKYIPADEYEKWLQTQFIGGTEPEIVMADFPLATKADWFKNGWIQDLQPFMEEESPYSQASWRDGFIDGLIESASDRTDSANPKLYGIPDQLTTVNLYYNKDIFAEIGLSGPPETITEMIEAAKKAKEAGYIGISIQNSIDWNLSWLATDLFSYLWRPRLAELDLNQSGIVEDSEWAQAARNGVLSADSPELQTYLQVMSDLSSYFNPGFNTASWEFEGLFNDGKSAMTINGSWYPNQHLQGEYPVNYGVAPIPYLDKEYSPLGDTVRHNYIAGGSPSLTITRNAEKNGKLETSVDFLRFWSDPNGGAKIVAEGLFQIPTVKDVPLPEVLQPIVAGFGTEEQVIFTGNAFTSEQKDAWLKAQQQVLDGKLAAEEMLRDYEKDLNSYVDRAVKAHPEWNVQ